MHFLGKPEAEAAAKVIMSGQLMRYRGGEGGHTDHFEEALCKKVGAKYAITMNSGTNALVSALVGLGVGPGDEVIVPAYTWVATALAPLAVGAVPVLADIDESLTIDPKDIERKITRHTKAIMPVHMSNLPCNMNAIMRLARKHGLSVCEDACQAVAVPYKKKYLGAIGQVGAFSFNFYKNMTCGEGGAILTNDRLIYERALMYHDAGCFTRDHASKISQPFFGGLNFRVSEIQGAILEVQLRQIDRVVKQLKARRAAAERILGKSSAFRVSPHNDSQNGVAISIVFDRAKDAAEFAAKHKLGRPIDSGRHVYTNWEPVMKQNVFHPRMNPFKWARRKITYTKDMCNRTLDILERTCTFSISYNEPLPALKKRARGLLSDS